MFVAADALVLALRALAFVATFQALGSALFLDLFGTRLAPAIAERVRAVARVAAFAALILAVVYYVLTPARLGGRFSSTFDPSLGQLLQASSSGTAQVLLVVGLALLALALDRATRLNTIATRVGAALALGSFALMGHTAIHPLRWLLAPALLVHLAAVGFWFGALWPLRLVALPIAGGSRGAASQAADAANRAREAREVVAAFSRLALRAVPAIFVCGVLLAVVFIRSLGELLTPYGGLVLAKAGGFGLLVALAALNKWRFTPALGRGDSGAARAFARTALVEWVLLAVILAGTAVMTAQFAPEHLEGAFGHGIDPSHPDEPAAR